MRTSSRYYKYSRCKVWSCPHGAYRLLLHTSGDWRAGEGKPCVFREAGPVHGDVKPDFQNADSYVKPPKNNVGCHFLPHKPCLWAECHQDPVGKLVIACTAVPPYRRPAFPNCKTAWLFPYTPQEGLLRSL